MGEKFIQHDTAGGLREVEGVTTGGAPSADRIPSLNASGQLDVTMLPTGVGADTQVITASEALAAGDFVNIFDDGGAFAVRKADASSVATLAHGFVLSAVANAAPATVFFEGNNTAVTGQTPGRKFLSATAGLSTDTAPTGSGEIVQRLGIATAATVINFEPQLPILLV